MTSQPSDEDSIPKQIGPYRIEARLGHGGMGEVYRGYDARLDRQVALKRVRTDTGESPTARDRFRREARAVAKLYHSAIVQVHDWAETDDGEWIVMELVDGRPLGELVSRGPLDPKRAARIARDVASGLATAHEVAIVHRDLTPGNVMLTSADEVKILDFGLAKQTRQADGEPSGALSVEGQVVGTMAYMSPEQALGRAVDARSDLFSLGTMLFEMLTGVLPFAGGRGVEVLANICTQRPRPIREVNPEVPAELAAIVERLLEKEAARRPQRAAEVVELINGYLDDTSNGTARPSFDPGITTTGTSRGTRAQILSQVASPASTASSEASLRTLLLSDLVDSTKLIERLGDRPAAELLERHDRLARDALARHRGREIDKSDGFLMLFELPLAAVLYALDYHAALAELSAECGVELASRVGIHVGEVVLRENTAEDVARGAKLLEVEGLAKAMAARFMSLGGPGQTLISHGVFEMARRGVVGSEGVPEALRWVEHGRYRMKGMEEPVEVFEVGVEGVAPMTAPPDSEKVKRVTDAAGQAIAARPGSGIRVAAATGSSAPAAWTAGPEETSAAALGAGVSTLSYLENLSHYTIVERIAAGGFGELYRAWDRKHERSVALKVLRPDRVSDDRARRGLRREAQALSRLHHPNIPTLYDAGTAEGIDFLVTEYVGTGSLAEQLDQGPLPESAVADLGAQVAAALAAAHETGILHRDLKASNVLVTAGGQAKLIDFGLARSTAPGGDSPQEHGPLPYLAPEILQGGEPDERSDLYSLGVLLYKMVTGQWPFFGQDVEELSRDIFSRQPQPPGELPGAIDPALEQVILRCLARDPADRFATAAEVAAELQPLATAATGAPAVPPRSRRRRLVTALATAAAVAVLAAAVQWWPRGSGTPGLDVDSVVVMPSRLLTPDTEPYLADAIPNTISTRLSEIEGLETKLPPSSFDVERFGGDLERVVEAYGVEALVLSTVSLGADGLILNLQLVSAAGRSLLWSQEYRGDPGSYLDLARRGAEGVRQVVRPESRVSPPAPAAGLTKEAETLLQQGSYYANLYQNQGREGDQERALEFFHRVLELDPRSARAAAEIAVLHSVSMDFGVSILEVGSEIRTWAERALEIDPRSSRAWGALAELEGSYPRLEYTLRAATYGPNDGYAQSSLVTALFEHSLTLALVAAREASRVDPLVLTMPIVELGCLSMLGRIEEALDRVDHVLGIEPGMPIARWTRAFLLSSAGRDREALVEVEEQLEPMAAQGMLHPAWVELMRDVALFGLASAAGERVEADRLASRLIAAARGDRPFTRWQGATSPIAQHLARHGRTEEALGLILHRSQQGVLMPYDALLFAPELEPLRSEPRFREALVRQRAEFDQMVAILEQASGAGEIPPYLVRPLADLMMRTRKAGRDG